MSAAGAVSAPTGRPQGPPIVGFVSPKSDRGCSSLVANVAAIMAAAGRRGLVVDWDTSGARVGDYLQPLHIAEEAADRFLAPELANRLEPALPQDASGTNRSAALVVRSYATMSASPSAALDVGQRPSGATVPVRLNLGVIPGLRTRLARSGYDVVLVDGPGPQ